MAGKPAFTFFLLLLGLVAGGITGVEIFRRFYLAGQSQPVTVQVSDSAAAVADRGTRGEADNITSDRSNADRSRHQDGVAKRGGHRGDAVAGGAAVLFVGRVLRFLLQPGARAPRARGGAHGIGVFIQQGRVHPYQLPCCRAGAEAVRDALRRRPDRGADRGR